METWGLKQHVQHVQEGEGHGSAGPGRVWLGRP